MTRPKVEIYTDGSCLGNPGPGGWAAILVLPGTSARKEICGGYAGTTNNRMEVLAAVMGLAALKTACEVTLFTDSSYLANAIEKGWLPAWEKRGWRKSDGKPVLNVDLWQRLQPLLKTHSVKFKWLKGHAGHAENERCDMLARNQASRRDLPEDPRILPESLSIS